MILNLILLVCIDSIFFHLFILLEYEVYKSVRKNAIVDCLLIYPL